MLQELIESLKVHVVQYHAVHLTHNRIPLALAEFGQNLFEILDVLNSLKRRPGLDSQLNTHHFYLCLKLVTDTDSYLSGSVEQLFQLGEDFLHIHNCPFGQLST